MKLIISDISDITCSAEDIIEIITDNGSIHPCVGCFGCWVKTPGRCVIRDGYENIGELMSKCTELIIVSRCTYGSFSPFVKNVLDRGLSYISPHFTVRSGELHHKRRYTNVISIRACFYGDVTDNEKGTAQRIVRANALNYDGVAEKVEFYPTAEEARRALQ